MSETETPSASFDSSPQTAVNLCREAWQRAYDDEFSKEESDYSASRVAARAFRLAMPTPSTEDSIRDFIACVSYGILADAIESKNASQLLYAAQVASGALTRARKSHRRKDFKSKKSAT